MGNDLSLLYQYKSDDSNNLYARRFMENSSKSVYLNSIKEKFKSKSLEDPNFKQKKITEPIIIKEAFSLYLQMDRKEKLTLLLNHPALTKEDFQEILELSVKATEKAFYTAIGGSVVTYLLYKRFLERYHVFYNFFRVKPKYKVFGYFKKTLGGLVLFYSWLGAANYVYKEKMKRQIIDKGYLKKYFVDIDSVYIEEDI